jgi:hypothetical protein
MYGFKLMFKFVLFIYASTALPWVLVTFSGSSSYYIYGRTPWTSD